MWCGVYASAGFTVWWWWFGMSSPLPQPLGLPDARRGDSDSSGQCMPRTTENMRQAARVYAQGRSACISGGPPSGRQGHARCNIRRAWDEQAGSSGWHVAATTPRLMRPRELSPPPTTTTNQNQLLFCTDAYARTCTPARTHERVTAALTCATRSSASSMYCTPSSSSSPPSSAPSSAWPAPRPAPLPAPPSSSSPSYAPEPPAAPEEAACFSAAGGRQARGGRRHGRHGPCNHGLWVREHQRKQAKPGCS